MVFPFVLLAGRSTAHRGIVCGSQTQRTAAKAWEYMRLKRKLKGLHLEFAGVDIEFHNFGNLSPSSVDLKAHVDPSDSTPIVNISPEAQNQLPMPSKIVLTYIDRQTTNSRNLVGLDHSGLTSAIQELVERQNRERMVILEQADLVEQISLEWEFSIMQPAKLTKYEQVRMAARMRVFFLFFFVLLWGVITQIIFGLHGTDWRTSCGCSLLSFRPSLRLSALLDLLMIITVPQEL